MTDEILFKFVIFSVSVAMVGITIFVYCLESWSEVAQLEGDIERLLNHLENHPKFTLSSFKLESVKGNCNVWANGISYPFFIRDFPLTEANKGLLIEHNITYNEMLNVIDQVCEFKFIIYSARLFSMDDDYVVEWTRGSGLNMNFKFKADKYYYKAKKNLKRIKII